MAILDLVKSFEKRPADSKKVFCFLVAVACVLVTGIVSLALKADPMLAGVIVSGITGLAGFVINQQQKVDSAVRAAALDAVGSSKPEALFK